LAGRKPPTEQPLLDGKVFVDHLTTAQLGLARPRGHADSASTI